MVDGRKSVEVHHYDTAWKAAFDALQAMLQGLWPICE